MKLLLIADKEERALWDDWNAQTAERLSDVELILSAGDLDADYLEFLVTMLNVPLVYVRGNHDGSYDEDPPEGCVDADGRVVDVECDSGSLRILGLGGSMRYNDRGSDMYTEEEMRRRARLAERGLLKAKLSDAVLPGRARRAAGTGRAFDILLTHAPCRGYGDMEDFPHMGFECFGQLMEKHRPAMHVYGHVHAEYGADRGKPAGGFSRETEHPSGTRLINANGHYIIEI